MRQDQCFELSGPPYILPLTLTAYIEQIVSFAVPSFAYANMKGFHCSHLDNSLCLYAHIYRMPRLFLSVWLSHTQTHFSKSEGRCGGA